MRYLTIFLAIFTSLVFVLAGCSSSSPAGTSTPGLSPTESPMATPGPTPTGPPSPSAIPPEVSQNTKDWPLPNHDYMNTRATFDAEINSSNVDTLGVAWVHNVPSGVSTFGSISTTPIIMGNTVYLQDIGNNIMALDRATGELKWQKVYNLANLGPNGVAVGYGKVYASAGPYDVVAVNKDTGEEVWRTTLINIDQGQNGIDMQPTVYDGTVYISTVPGNAGVFYAGGGIGTIHALDQENGNVSWSFDTVDSKDVWGNPAVNSGGGCWYPPAIDLDSGWSYWGIANPAPFPGIRKGPGISQDWPNGSSRPGPNLYTNTMMQLNHETGEMGWYTQVWPHDISDYDLSISPILASANYSAIQQDIVIGAGKMGRVYAFNREKGYLLWQTFVGEHNGNDRLAAYPTNSTITVLPGVLGGVETPMAYADGVLYVAANNLAVDYTNGLDLRVHPFSEGTGDFVAIDVNTGHVLWNKKLKSQAFGAATVVNDLVFTSTYDGMLYAFKRDTGEQVWSYKAPAFVNAWPAVAGDTIVWPAAGGGGPSSILGFRLGATTPTLKIVEPAANATLPAGNVTVQVEVNNFKLVDKLGNQSVAGEGHIHYFLDVQAPTTPGEPAIPPAGSVWAATANTSHTFNLSPGNHTISVELVNNDYTPLSPPVVRTVNVTADTKPRITISDPKNGAIRRAGNITISVDVTNFNLVDKLGQAAVPGEGHIQYFLDVEPPTEPGKPAIPAGNATWAASASTSHTFGNVTTGIHHFYVELVNNDHTPLEPAVTAEIQVYAITYTGGLGGQ